MFTSAGTAFGGGFAYREIARAAFVVIDLQFNSAATGTNPDSDHNGLADAWEIQYFGHIGVDPTRTPTATVKAT